MALVIAPPLETWVIVLDHPPISEPRIFPLADAMTVGRLGYRYDGVPIQLADPLASAGRHAMLRRTPGGLTVNDMGSGNTTRLNGKPQRESALLHVGDEVQTGNTILRFEHTLAGDPWPEGARPLLDRVLASPDDDLPRRILADWLHERGDPRGEFITCQLAGTAAAQQQANGLLSLNELAWLAPLTVPVERWTFARGFLATVRVRDVSEAEVLRKHHPLVVIEPLAPAQPRPAGEA